jgi:hypothetical protein
MMKRAMVAVGFLVASTGCGKAGPAPAITCGSGTVLKGSECVVAERAATPNPVADAGSPAAPPDAAPDASTAGWKYETHRDQMREEDTRIARIEGEPIEPIQGGPFKLYMSLVQGDKDKVPFVMFVAEGTRFECDSVLCFRARFDKQEVKPWPAMVDGKGGALVMAGTDKAKTDWVELVKSSSEAIAEFRLLGHGRQQFTFKVAGLVWDEAPSKK